ncbi:11259_t:CDS:2, partial [Scutellospora calospora]
DDYDLEFSNYNLTSDNSYSFDQDNDTLASYHFIKNFFEHYEKPGICPEDKPITKLRCKVADYTTEYYQPPCINTIKNEVADGYYYTTQTIKQMLHTYTGLWLTNDLENSTNTDYHHDGANIRDKLLLNKEYNTVRALVDFLYPFHKATKILSRSTYATLSIMVSTIEELIYCLNNTISELDIINELKDVILSDLSRRWSSPHKYG